MTMCCVQVVVKLQDRGQGCPAREPVSILKPFFCLVDHILQFVGHVYLLIVRIRSPSKIFQATTDFDITLLLMG